MPSSDKAAAKAADELEVPGPGQFPGEQQRDVDGKAPNADQQNNPTPDKADGK